LTVIEHLQENVKDVRMCLFDFVQQDDRVGFAPNGFGELAAFFVADVARGGADEARDGELFHVFRHVDADHRVLFAEQDFGDRARQLRLSHAGGTEEYKGTDRFLGSLRPVRDRRIACERDLIASS